MKETMLKNKKCRVCSSPDIEIVYRAPLMPLGGQLIEPKDEFKSELFYPLHYVLCRDCSTFQSIEMVPEKILATENTCISSTAKTITKRETQLFSEIQKFFGIGSKNFIVDVGGSDGSFLKQFLERNIPVLNIEPVQEVAKMSRESGVETKVSFLSEKVASRIVAKRGKADLVVAKYVLELVPDLHQFIESCSIMLAPKGRICVEVPYIKDIIDGNFYDLNAHLRIYHFSLTSLERLFSMHGLAIEKVIPYKSIGGGIRFYAGWKDKVSVSDSVKDMLKKERQWGVNKPKYYKNSLKRGIKLRRDLLELINSLKRKGKKIVGFGAGIKASALLNYCGLDGRYIEYLVDNGKHKQGKLMPGVRLPIYSPKKIDDSIDYVLILAWLYKDEIVESLRPFTNKGGKIIIPAPKVQTL